MKEDAYWRELYKLFVSLGDDSRALFGGWIDWIEPRKYCMGWRPPCVLGRMGFLDGREMREWTFRLLLDRQYASAEEIRWEHQLPTEDGEWLRVDDEGSSIEIVVPGAA